MIAFPPGRLQAAQQASVDQIRIEIDADLLSVTVGEAPLQRVLEAIARKAALRLETKGDLGSVRPQALTAMPLSEGIRRLVGDNRVHLIMRYEVGESGERRLVAVTARAAGEVPAAFLEQRRMRTELSRVPIPPPPPPPPMR